jgi:hypothetical protein
VGEADVLLLVRRNDSLKVMLAEAVNAKNSKK